MAPLCIMWGHPMHGLDNLQTGLLLDHMHAYLQMRRHTCAKACSMQHVAKCKLLQDTCTCKGVLLECAALMKYKVCRECLNTCP